MEYGNAARFLKSYNRIESQLKFLYGAHPAVNFTDLVKRCTDRNLTVRRYENELVDYGKLRNAIVHRSGGGELFIANPCDDVVDNIEYIERQICNPPRATAAVKPRKIASVFADKPLLTAVQAFAQPVFTAMACARPARSFARSCSTGAAATRLVVKTPAAAHGTSETINATSRRSAYFTPASTPAARKPCAAVTPPSKTVQSAIFACSLQRMKHKVCHNPAPHATHPPPSRGDSAAEPRWIGR